MSFAALTLLEIERVELGINNDFDLDKIKTHQSGSGVRRFRNIVDNILASKPIMGNGMNKILPGLYVGNYRDSRDAVQLTKNHITHILSIHDNAKPILDDKKYLCITASDSAEQDIMQYFSQCNEFIHSARTSGGGVLVHCLAGVSRSVTVTVAYVMSVTSLGWREALSVVRASRTCASPNFGFQRQLHHFQFDVVDKEREKLKKEYSCDSLNDVEECQRILEEVKLAAAQSAAADNGRAADASCSPVTLYENKFSGNTGGSGNTTGSALSSATSTDCHAMYSALQQDLSDSAQGGAAQVQVNEVTSSENCTEDGCRGDNKSSAKNSDSDAIGQYNNESECGKNKDNVSDKSTGLGSHDHKNKTYESSDAADKRVVDKPNNIAS